jgi:hypothetical protein
MIPVSTWRDELENVQHVSPVATTTSFGQIKSDGLNEHNEPPGIKPLHAISGFKAATCAVVREFREAITRGKDPFLRIRGIVI